MERRDRGDTRKGTMRAQKEGRGKAPAGKGRREETTAGKGRPAESGRWRTQPPRKVRPAESAPEEARSSEHARVAALSGENAPKRSRTEENVPKEKGKISCKYLLPGFEVPCPLKREYCPNNIHCRYFLNTLQNNSRCAYFAKTKSGKDGCRLKKTPCAVDQFCIDFKIPVRKKSSATPEGKASAAVWAKLASEGGCAYLSPEGRTCGMDEDCPNSAACLRYRGPGEDNSSCRSRSGDGGCTLGRTCSATDLCPAFERKFVMKRIDPAKR